MHVFLEIKVILNLIRDFVFHNGHSVQESEVQWMNSYYLTCVITVVTYGMYQIYGTSKIQPWNYPPKLLQTDDIRQDETDDVDSDYNTRLKQKFINI